MATEAWREYLELELAELPQDAIRDSGAAYDALVRAAQLGRAEDAQEAVAVIRTIAERARGAGSDSVQRIEATLRLLYRVVRTVLASLTLLLSTSCVTDQGMIKARDVKGTVDAVVARHQAFVDDDPHNNPMPDNAEQRALWLMSGTELKRTVDAAAEEAK